jgi:hypothetical protein
MSYKLDWWQFHNLDKLEQVWSVKTHETSDWWLCNIPDKQRVVSMSKEQRLIF